MLDKTESIIGCILGTAVGDGIGLPYEGLASKRIPAKIIQHRLIANKGMISDDTEHTCMTAQSLIVSAGDERKFTQGLAWRLRWWLLCLPAGIGKATLLACVKLWLGFPPSRSGIFSAGNGAAMRSAILGVCYGENLSQLRSLVRINTRVTHCDPKAEYGAFAVAYAAYLASCQTVSPQEYYSNLEQILGQDAKEFLELVQKACDSARRGETGQEFAHALGYSRGISGYVYATVPVAIQIWLRYSEDYKRAIEEIIKLGGDTDTTAAILGGIIGSGVGKSGIPSLWLDHLWEYPRTVAWMEALGRRLAEVVARGRSQSALPLPIYGILLRNLFFVLIVLFHGFRRLFPPYSYQK